MTNMVKMPYMIKKTFKNLLLQKQLTYGLETLFVALCIQVLPAFFNDNLSVTLTFLRQGQIRLKY